jgi:hypothetical protein
MANHMWQGPTKTLYLGVGVSCCTAPSEDHLGAAWDRHRPAMLALLSAGSLQGISLRMDDEERRLFDVEISELNMR